MMLESRHFESLAVSRHSSIATRIQQRRTRRAHAAERLLRMRGPHAGTSVRPSLRESGVGTPAMMSPTAPAPPRSEVNGLGLTHAAIEKALREYGPAWALGVADSVSKRDLVFILAAQGILGSNPLEHDNRQRRRKSRHPLRVVRIDFNHGDDSEDRLRRLFHTLLGPNGAVHDEDGS